MFDIIAPMDSVVVRIQVKEGDTVSAAQEIAVLEAMKMQHALKSSDAGVVTELRVEVGDTISEGDLICRFDDSHHSGQTSSKAVFNEDRTADSLRQNLRSRLRQTQDEARGEARDKRHARGYRTARENLDDLVDPGSFQEYGQLAVAAQRSRKSAEQLQIDTAADGIVTGIATVNQAMLPTCNTQVAIAINDYSVLAGTQGYFHHHKLDRLLALAAEQRLPVIMYTEGGGGRPGDTDALVSMAGLHVGSFRAWAQLSGLVPRIAVNNGFCFAGNAALFGCADLTIATRNSWIGMAGPAMIEGGGLGSVDAKEIGPIEVQSNNGVVDLVADNEAHATRLAKQCLSYFQGTQNSWRAPDQSALRAAVPGDRRAAYAVREVIEILADQHSFIELRPGYASGIVTGYIRIEGRPFGLIANDCHVLGGAVDANGARKAARFIQLCDGFNLPVVSLIDTPGFMVGPSSETQAAVRKMSSMFVAGASISTPLVAIFLRRGYGLGAMAMAGGSFHAPVYSAAWPTGEFGPMGLEGAVKLGFKKELAAKPEGAERDALYQSLLAEMTERGRATEAAAFLEIDAVIDPVETRATIIRAVRDPVGSKQMGRRRTFVDTW